MVSQLTAKTVEEHSDHYHVVFRDSESFDELETPGWATDLAESEVPGSDIKMGQTGTDEWLVQSVLVPTSDVDGEDDASRRALEVVTVISERTQPD